MLLSVIVPVYNMAAEGKLNYCLDSLAGQKTLEGTRLADYEILAVDDCSMDNSWDILQEYGRRFPDRVVPLRTPRNLHQGGAKNLALSKARGDWLAFIDADDWVTPNYFAKLLQRAEETGADCVGCDYSMVSEHTMTPGQVVHNSRAEQCGELDQGTLTLWSEKKADPSREDPEPELQPGKRESRNLAPEDLETAGLSRRRSLMVDFGSLCVKIYRRELILGCPSRFPEDMFYEDNAIARTWISRMHHFEYVPEALYFYYQHEDSTVHTVTRARLEDRMKAGRMMLEEARRYGYFERFRPELEYSFTVLFYKNTLFSAMRGWKGRGCCRFVTALGQEMHKTFPDFQQNVYYKERTDAEELHYMAMQMVHPLRFYIQYKLLWLWRDLRG